MIVDAATQANLELVDLARRRRDTSLLAALDRTVTPMGARRLRDWILHPLCALEPLARAPGFHHRAARGVIPPQPAPRVAQGRPRHRAHRRPAQPGRRQRARPARPAKLPQAPPGPQGPPPFARPSASTSAQTAAPPACARGPRGSCTNFPTSSPSSRPPSWTNPRWRSRRAASSATAIPSRWTNCAPPAREGKEWIAQLQQREIDRTGIKSLKIRYTSVFGYFIEITKSNLASVPARLPPQADHGQRRALHHPGAQGDGEQNPRRRRAGAGARVRPLPAIARRRCSATSPSSRPPPPPSPRST